MLSDWALDLTFDSDGMTTTEFFASSFSDESTNAVALQSDGKILAAGTGGAFARYTADGSIDTSFGEHGKVAFKGTAQAIAVQSDGKILVVSYTSSSTEDYRIARYLSDGTLDSTFAGGGILNTDYRWQDIAVQSDGKIVVAGTDGVDFLVARYLSDGSPDASFDGDGSLATDFGGGDVGYGLALQSDGKIVVAGSSYRDSADIAVARYHSDGSLDTTFDGDGKATTSLGPQNDIGYCVAVQSDGKIVVAGIRGTFPTYTDFALIRYNTDGSLDSSFADDGIQTTPFKSDQDVARSVMLLDDGRILVAGDLVKPFTKDYDIALACYRADGSLDSSFDGDGMLTLDIPSVMTHMRAAVVQSDGKILVGGYTSGIDSILVRFHQDGTLDASFGTGGIQATNLGQSNDIGSDVIVQSDGKILVAGSTDRGDHTDFALVRYNADGSRDLSFGDNGRVITDFGLHDDSAKALVLQPNGKIVVAGTSTDGTNADFAVARYNSDGSLDMSFGRYGLVTTDLGSAYDTGTDVILQSDGKIVVAGQSRLNGTHRIGIARYHANGRVDTSFSGDGLLTTESPDSTCRLFQVDGKIVVFGAESYSSYGNWANFVVARFDSQGNPDITFDGDGRLAVTFETKDARVQGAALQSDGKMIVVGSVANYRSDDLAVARYNADGSLDTSFDGDGKLSTSFEDMDTYARDVVVQSDGKIVVVGVSNGDFAIARYQSDGSLDASFSGDGKATTSFGESCCAVTGVTLQSDGKIVVVGSSIGRSPDFAVARYRMVNEAPTANPDTATVAEDGSVRISVLDNDIPGAADETGQSLAVASAFALLGSVVVEADGTLTYVPPADYFGDDTISYTIVDDGTTEGVADPRTASGTVAVTVAAADDAPVSVSDAATVLEAGTVEIDVLANDTDVDNQDPTPANTGLIVAAVTQGSHGTAAFTAAGVTYSPDAGFNGWDSFTYTIEDAAGLASTATVQVTVAAPPPTAGGPYRISEGQALTLAAKGSACESATYRWDIDGDGDFDENITGAAPTVAWPVLDAMQFDGPTTRSITVEMTTPTGTATASTNFTVANAKPGTQSFGGDDFWYHPGEEARVRGVFADPSLLDTLSATISWGDGTTQTIPLTVIDGEAVLEASHCYAFDGSYWIYVSVSDDDGGWCMNTRSANVGDVSWHDGQLDIVGTADGDALALGLQGDWVTFTHDFLTAVPAVWLSEIASISVTFFEGDDTLSVDPAIDVPITVNGGAGDDVLQTGSGDDWLYGHDGNDTLSGGAGQDRMYGQMGDDTLYGGADRDLMSGQGGNDWLGGEDGNDILYGNGGNDYLFGHRGKDRLFGHEGGDVLVGGADNDRLSGSLGRDILLAGTGADWVMGHADSDLLAGGPTAYDDDQEALVALMAVWLEGALLSERIKTITQGFGTGNLYALSPADTVLTDSALDELAGNGGSDWYLTDAADLLITGGGDWMTRG